MGLQRVPYQKFGGLSLVDSPYDLDGHKSPDLSNVRFDDPSSDESMGQRLGKTNLVSGSLAAAPTVAVRDAMANLNGSDLFLSGGDGDIYKLSLGSTLALWTKIFNSAAVPDWIIIGTADSAGSPATYFMPTSTTDTPKKWPLIGGVMVAWPGTPPTQGLAGVYWRGRVVIAGYGNRLLYSDVGNPESPAAGYNFIDIYDQASSANCALLVHRNNLYLFKDRSIWLIYDPNTFANRLIVSETSTWDRFTVCSNPVTNRMYWWSPVDGHIHSSNGETDNVIETRDVAPLLRSLPHSYAVDSDLPHHYRLVVDPQTGSVMFAFTTSTSTSAHDNDQMLEICCSMGKPGNHEILLHNYSTRALFTIPTQVPSTNFAHPSQVLVASSESAASEIHQLFNGTNDDGAAIVSRYTSSWAPFISEEPMERIRRMNFLYRGDPVIDVSSTPTPEAAPSVVTFTPTSFAGADSLDRTYTSMKGPNRKGRYHRFQVRNSVLDKAWSMSALEFVLRGGKSKK